MALCTSGGDGFGQRFPAPFESIGLSGFQPGAALATVVGVLVDVPVTLSVVAIVNASRGWYESHA